MTNYQEKQTITIPNAAELERSIWERTKEEKFEKMITKQLALIESYMTYHLRSTIWIFGDKSNFAGFEKEWANEFEERAKKMFIDAGYKIDKNISW